jgi:hypothetical protein
MKKTIFALIVAGLLIATPIQAQSDEAIRANLQEQINILLQLVIQLQDRLAEIIAEQAAQQVQIQQVEEKVEAQAQAELQEKERLEQEEKERLAELQRQEEERKAKEAEELRKQQELEAKIQACKQNKNIWYGGDAKYQQGCYNSNSYHLSCGYGLVPGPAPSYSGFMVAQC